MLKLVGLTFLLIPLALEGYPQTKSAGAPARLPKPWSDAEVVWHLADRTDATCKHPLLKPQGEGVKTGVSLPDDQRAASRKRGGDGIVATFDGSSWLALESSPGENLFPAPETLTVFARVKATKTGGLFHSNLFSLVIHESGLAVAILGVADAQGAMYREIPLSPLTLNAWHDVAVRYRAGFLDFVVDGKVLNHVSVPGKPRAILTGPTVLGGWRIDNPPVSSFPKPVIAFLFQRLFTGSMDHAAVWNRALTDGELAGLSGVSALTGPDSISDAQRCLADYHAFFTASRQKDTVACQRLGLSMRRFMARDPKRPTYHLTAPMDAILDPAGAFYHKDQYHVFSYRNLVSLLACNPLAHYVSDDLIHWKDRPIALWPDSDLDVNGIWLANLFFDDQQRLSTLYTALGKEGKYGVLARSHDDLLSFTDKQAVMTGMVHHDGHTWKDGTTWYSLTTRQHWGKRPGDLGDAIVLLSSPDLVNWTEQGTIFDARKHPAPRSDQQRQGFTEYPYLLPFGDKHVLITGTRPVQYWVGRFDPSKPAFIPDDPTGKLLDYLNPFHCFNPSAIDHKGPRGTERRIIQAMHLYTSGQVDGIPWYGAHVLPRILTRQGDRLWQEPVPEVEILRGRHEQRKNILVQPGATDLLAGIQGDVLEIIAEFDPGTATRFGLKVRTAEDGQGGTKVFYDVTKDQFGAVDNLKIPAPYPELGQGPAYLQKGQRVRMRLFLDRSMLEVFVNGQTGSGIFNNDVKGMGLDLFSEGGNTTLISLDVWELKPAWPLTN